MIGPQIGPQFPAKIQIIVLGKSPKFEGKKAPKYGTLADHPEWGSGEITRGKFWKSTGKIAQFPAF